MNTVGGADVGAAEMVRKYKAWEGSNKFCLGGRFIFGPDVRSVSLTVFLIIAPAAVFCVFVARKLMDDFSGDWGIAVLVVFIVSTVYVLVLLLLTSGRDPGIVPRNAQPPEPETNNLSTELGSGHTPRLPRTKDFIINGATVKVKYCDTCMLYRPPRCSHCSICDNCVERFDHHCPWVGQCIGLRNYRFFYMFVFSTMLLCLYVHGFCWVYIKKIMDSENSSIWKAMAKTPASIVLIVYTFLALWFVGGLSIFHLYLITTNQTTYENFRYQYSRRANPYNRGIVGNIMDIFCSSIPKSKNDFRAKVQKKQPMIPSHSVGDSFDSTTLAVSKRLQGKSIWDETNDKALAIGSNRVTLSSNGESVTEYQQYL
ncbi:probable protein S-acyltransferase 7 [Salvia hispanica]|uniref:probable protein S-acyltransferase 7 n=1 Tax=Salvia hispanica TaxID=49212 RepID=UPI0020094E46|nr:probable protein S-acyltransferase 7 [Salvia hispanica]